MMNGEVNSSALCRELIRRKMLCKAPTCEEQEKGKRMLYKLRIRIFGVMHILIIIQRITRRTRLVA
jgi:hypothetical protein